MGCPDFVFEYERLLVVARSAETFYRNVSTGLLNLPSVARVITDANFIDAGSLLGGGRSLPIDTSAQVKGTLTFLAWFVIESANSSDLPVLALGQQFSQEFSLRELDDLLEDTSVVDQIG